MEKVRLWHSQWPDQAFQAGQQTAGPHAHSHCPECGTFSILSELHRVNFEASTSFFSPLFFSALTCHSVKVKKQLQSTYSTFWIAVLKPAWACGDQALLCSTRLYGRACAPFLLPSIRRVHLEPQSELCCWVRVLCLGDSACLTWGRS